MKLLKPELDAVFKTHYQDFYDSLNSQIQLETLLEDSKKKKSLSNQSGIYIISESNNLTNGVIYIGQTKKLDFRTRIIYNLLGNGAHTLKNKLLKHELKCKNMDQVKDFLKSLYIAFIEIQDPKDRTLFEHFAIAIFRPKYNDEYIPSVGLVELLK